MVKRKPIIVERNQKKRQEFARQHVMKDMDFWKRVMFCDESQFKIFGSNCRQFVWRKPNETLNKINLQPTVKRGGGGVMVWGCMSASGVGNLHFIEGKVEKYGYLQILRDNVKVIEEKLGIQDSFVFYQDNDPKHASHAVREWCLYNCPKVLQPPP